MIDNVFVIPVLRPTYIHRCIETLYKYTPDINFKVIVVDQTKNGMDDIDGVHLTLRPYRNLGFAKAMNEGIIHGLRWKSKYITCWNDDVECMDKRWWSGIIDTFKMETDKEILAVNPESPRMPMWGYGLRPDLFLEIIDYKKNFTKEDYDFLLEGKFQHLEEKYDWLPDAFPREYHGVCDGIAAWGTVFKRKHFDLIGFWDERFYPGGAEDYDMMCRMYSKNYRAVSTRGSWVWHWWGHSKDNEEKVNEEGLPIEQDRKWADTSYLWPNKWNNGNEMDIWGFYENDDGERVPYKRRKKVAVVEI